jgi:hypothetical protein|tara:strand:+ start:470 stop:661 length:192 start_codon:yes stop_codon:yes gene_type:complete
MIIFTGDFVQLVQHNSHGSNGDWLEVQDVDLYDMLVLSNGARVPATELYIHAVKLAEQYRVQS